MPGTYSAPGVYVEEVPSGAAPIAGVGTSTAGFIGYLDGAIQMPTRPVTLEIPRAGGPSEQVAGEDHYLLAPAGEPQLITSWAQFTATFGDFQAGNKALAHAVYGFFNNGGTRCWVARVAAADAGTVETALMAFEAIDEIALVAAPGMTAKEVQTEVVKHCEKVGTRFAILDGQQTPATLTPAPINGGLAASDHAALYYPWIQVYDPISKAPDYVAPSGHVAGVYARVDAERGVHKAPANVVIRGALGVQRRLSRTDQDGLNPAGINVIRAFDGSVTIWGARTLADAGHAEWRYINVRRLFLFLRASIDQGTRWVVFEPNSPALWAQITRNVTAFLTTVWRDGALFGATPQQAFYVRCDENTNPPAVRDLGQVITEIGVAVVKPAEFVIFRVSQWAGPGQ